jgi:hypothetical protein
MSKSRKRKARKSRRLSLIQSGARIKPTPETAAKLKPHPLELLLARGREGGGIDADQWQCAEEIVDAVEVVARGLGVAGNDWEMRRYHHEPSANDISPRAEHLASIWFAWAVELRLRDRLRPFVVVDMIRTVNPTDARAVGCLCRGLDLWAKVRGNLRRPVREVSTIRPNTA